MCTYAADEQERAYVERVALWIEQRLNNRAHSFGSLVASLPGVDPTVVAASLRALVGRGSDGGAAAAVLLQDAASTPATVATTCERPLPHPLEFYWAYTPESIEALVFELASIAGQAGTIAYLGTPNIFRFAAENLIGHTHVLLDRSVPRTSALSNGTGRVERLDLLRDELPLITADVAILDPPWYPDHMRSFLWAAAFMVREGAEIWATFPPSGTRPAVEGETADVLDWAAAHGLELIERRLSAVRYLSPPFELASHRAAKLGGIPRDWRVAELVRLRLNQAVTDSRPPPPADKEVWLAFAIDEIPLWVRERPSDGKRVGSGLLHPVVTGDVLQSVSRRDARRYQVDVWTSLNRVWASSHPQAVQATCRALAEEVDPISAVESDLVRELAQYERDHVRQVADHLREVVRREREEHGL